MLQYIEQLKRESNQLIKLGTAFKRKQKAELKAFVDHARC